MNRFIAVVPVVASWACNRPEAVDANRGSPLADASQGTAATAATGASIPPIDTRCSRDAECTAVGFEVEGPRACCTACGTTAVSTTWAITARAFCSPSRIATLPCPPLACPQGRMTTRCDRGTCVLSP